jgi:hypothetical protein
MDVDRLQLKSLPQIISDPKHRGMAIALHIKGSTVKGHFRTLFIAYNTFVRMLFMDGIRDHQWFKAMSHEAAAVLRHVKSDGFFFDTEMIAMQETGVLSHGRSAVD